MTIEEMIGKIKEGKEGREGAYSELWNHIRRIILSRAQNLLGQRYSGKGVSWQGAEDILSRVAVRFCNKIKEFDYKSDGEFYAWIHAIIVSAYAQYIREEKKSKTIGTLTNEERKRNEPVVISASDYEEGKAISKANDILLRAFSILNKEEAIIIAYKFKGLTYEQIFNKHKERFSHYSTCQSLAQTGKRALDRVRLFLEENEIDIDIKYLKDTAEKWLKSVWDNTEKRE